MFHALRFHEGRQLDRRNYLLKNIYQVHLLAVRILGEKKSEADYPHPGFDRKDPVCCSEHLRERLEGCGVRGKYAVYDDGGYFYCVYRGGEAYAVWGPFVIEVHSEYQDRMYLGRNRVKEKTLSIPLMELSYAKGLISFLHGVIFEDYRGVAFLDDLIRETEGEQLQADIAGYIVDNAVQGRVHSSYQREREFFEHLLDGRLGSDNWMPFGAQENFRDLKERQGIVAESRKKQMEYSAVSYITLLTRHVMAAGVDEASAYLLSDVCLQEISRTDSVLEMERILKNCVLQFLALVKEHRMSGSRGSPYVERCRDYIAKHIFEKLSVAEIAGALGVHPSYLSRLFAAETGTAISRYILQEKIHVSCNLIKYSGQSIAAIADYVSLSPQSYFSRVFKRVMNRTPAQYRKENQSKKFL